VFLISSNWPLLQGGGPCHHQCRGGAPVW